MLLLLGIAAMGWSAFSLITGKGYYRGCPPGGYDRQSNPYNFWIPTLFIALLGMWLVLGSFGIAPGLHRGRANACLPVQSR